MPDDRELDPALAEAVDWIVRLSSGKATEADAQALSDWRARDPANDRAFRAMAGVRPAARALKQEPAGMSRRAVLAGGGALALTTLGLARPPLGLWPSFTELAADRRTAPGEREAFTPVAGVDIEMNARTSLSLLDGGRGIDLIQGETFVAIQRTGGFLVRALDVAVTARLARLNILILGGEVRVSCLGGDGTCTRGGRTMRLARDEGLAFKPDGRIERRALGRAQPASWRDGFLMFQDTPLAEVIEQFNRHRPRPIWIAGGEIGARAVSGVFYTDNIDAAVTQLQLLLSLHRRELPGGIVLLS